MSAPDTTWQSPDTMPIGTIVAGRYRLERLLGKGGFGAVFLALNANDGTRVALKVLSRSVLDMVGGDARFRREADLARRLRHPNVVRVLDTGVDAAGALYIAFEHLDGRSVQEEIVERGVMAPERAARLVIEVLRALEEAHAMGIIHRDLKPANLFILGHGAPAPGNVDRIKVLDFGIAKSTNPGTLAGLTQQGTTLGTPTYMAPEQMTGGELTPAADLFAMGVVLTELCLGRPLYGKDASALELFRERLMGQPIPVPDDLARSPIGAVIQKATATQAEHRYRSAAEMREALEGVLPLLASGPPVPATHVPSTLGGPYAGSPTVAGQSPAAWSGAAPVPMPMPPAPPPWSPPMAHPGAAMHTPMAQATTGPYVTPSRGGSGMVPIAIVIGVFVLGVGLVVAFLVVGSSDDRVADKDRASQRKSADRDRQAEEDEEADEEEEDDEELAEADGEESDADEEGPEGPGAAVEDEPAHEVRVLQCSAVATLQKPALSSHLSAIGWSVTGDLTYCPGSMVNFRCIGGDGRGVTAENDGRSGQVAIIRFSSGGEAQAYVNGEKSKDEELTLVHSGSVVLRVELPEADADRLVSRFCSA